MDRDTVAPLSVLRASSLSACLLSALAFGPMGSAQALGLGSPLVHSSLGQPLHLSFPLNLRSGESLAMDCVFVDVTAGTTRLPAGVLSVRLEGESETSVRSIRVLSSVAIEEPILNVALSLGCPVQLTRQFSALMDPPGAQAANASKSLPAQASPRVLSPALRAALATADAQPESLMGAGLADKVAQERLIASKLAQAKASKADAKLVSKAVSPQANEDANWLAVQSSKGSKQSKIGKSALTVASPLSSALAQSTASPLGPNDALAQARSRLLGAKENAGPQLRLESFDANLAPAQQSASAAEAALTRLQSVESGLTKLQAEYRNNVQKLTALREVHAATQSAGGDSGWSAWPWGLAALTLLLGGGLGYLWRGRQRELAGHDANWWAQQTNELASHEPKEDQLTNSAELASQVADETRAGAGGKLRKAAVDGVDGVVVAEGVDSAELPQVSFGQIRDAGPAEQTIALARNTEADAAVSTNALVAELPEQELSGLARISQLMAGDLSLEPLSVQFIDREEGKLGSGGGLAEGAGTAASAPPHWVSVEELIDLEQQVDFFLVLGQDEAAVDLLQTQLKNGVATGSISALPYLKLMEICQQRGDALAFAEIASQYAVQFKAQPPAWELELAHGRGLEAYEDVVRGLQSRWSDSGASMANLQKLLSCAEERSSRFDLPALLDLLLLYSVARDRSEHEVRGEEIDLFLPLDANDAGVNATGFDLMATMVWQGKPGAAAGPVDVDILLDGPSIRGPLHASKSG